MNTWIAAIKLGLIFYGMFAMILSVPYEVIKANLMHRVNLMDVITKQAFICYLFVFVALVWFPLPTSTMAVTLSTHDIQYIPFKFVYDIVREKSLFSVLQVLFNVCLTVPFGALLTYKFNASKKVVAIASFCLSVLAEVGQITGLFFMYNGSYRLFDVDDLFLNTIGGLIGFFVAVKVMKYIPAIDNFNMSLNKKRFGLLGLGFMGL